MKQKKELQQATLLEGGHGEEAVQAGECCGQGVEDSKGG
jgi:hypothetical protein